MSHKLRHGSTKFAFFTQLTLRVILIDIIVYLMLILNLVSCSNFQLFILHMLRSLSLSDMPHSDAFPHGWI